MFMSYLKYSILLCLVVNLINVFINGNIQLCDTELLTTSTAASDDPSSKDPDKVEPYFNYFQILRITLLDIEHNEEDMIEFLHQYYANNETILKMVDQFEEEYHRHSPIWWYRRECFLSSLINRALQTMDMRIIIKMSLFLRDLCQEIENLHGQKRNSSDSFTVYRCSKFSLTNFKKVQENNDVYMSFNSFLLASSDQELENEICSKSEEDNEILPVLIEIQIEDTISEFTPFVWLDHSNSKKEILFSMNSVFRITNIAKNSRNICRIQMVGINANDSSLGFAFALIRLRTAKKKDWEKLDDMMILMRQAEHAENLYKVLLELVDMDEKEEIIRLYDKLSTIKLVSGSYEEAHFFLEKKLQIQQHLHPSNHLDLASTYSAIGIANSKMGRFENALSFHGKALEIRKSLLPSNHQDVSITYDNIAIVHSKMGNHLIALSFYQEALQINEEVLPFYNHDRAINYNNIAAEYKFLGDYEKALELLEKVLQIEETILSADDPELAFTYDNIAAVYQDMNQYDKALFFYEKALKISEKVLHSNHPELAVTYNNIASLQFDMGDYQNSLSFYQKAIEIARRSPYNNRLTIVNLYHGIGNVYRAMRQSANALSFYEKALQIQKLSLPEYHSDFVLTYIKIGNIYYADGKYPTALSYFERGLEIGEVSLPESHQWLTTLRQSIALIEKEL